MQNSAYFFVIYLLTYVSLAWCLVSGNLADSYLYFKCKRIYAWLNVNEIHPQAKVSKR